MIDRHLLDDHAAHGHARDVGRRDAVGVEHRDGVEGHVGEPVGDVRDAAIAYGRDHVGDSRRDVLELRGQPDVTVVEANDEETVGHEALAERHVVVDALTAETVDEEQRFVARGAERLV